jgi:F0F1-type ATP synthase assembly protein I
MPFHRPIPESKPPREPSGGVGAWIEAEKLMQIAILLPSAAFIGWLFGALADKWLHQKWIALAGIVFGGISGLVYVVRLAMTTETGTPADSKNEDEKGGPIDPALK